jgi:hypothetical protein
MRAAEQAVVSGLDLATAKNRANDTSGLPDLLALERVEGQALWVLAFMKDKVGTDYLSAAEISAVLADVFELSADESAVRMALTRSGNKVHSKLFGRTKKFTIMKPGREYLAASSSDSTIIVDPQKPHRAIVQISELLGGLSGVVRICDPYLDKKTLEVTAMLPDRCDVRFLSTPPKDGPAFLRHLKAYRLEHPNLAIRCIPPGRIHDRYLITTQDMWLIGHSLNAIGSKQTLVTKLGGDVRTEIGAAFESMWAAGAVLT